MGVFRNIGWWRLPLSAISWALFSGCGSSPDATGAMEAAVAADPNPGDGGGAADGSFEGVILDASADAAPGILTPDAGLSERMPDAPADGLVTRDSDAATDALGGGGLDATTDVLGDGSSDADTYDTAQNRVRTDGATSCPPLPAPCLILPLGDSITDGFTVPGGYRVPLFHRVLAAGQHATFVGSQQNGPAQVDGVSFPPDHEGHVGFAIDPFGDREGISPLTPGALRTYQPHIVTLMIGTNDMDLQFDVANAPTRLGALLDSIFRTAPDVAVVLAQITPTSDDALNQRIAAYNAAMNALVDAQLSAGRNIQLVDMYGAMTSVADYRTTLLGDRLHPNEAGYSLMADVWYGALAAMLR